MALLSPRTPLHFTSKQNHFTQTTSVRPTSAHFTSLHLCTLNPHLNFTDIWRRSTRMYCGTPYINPMHCPMYNKSLTVSLTHSLSLSHTHTRTHTPYHSLTLSLSHTHAHTISLTLSLKHTHTHAHTISLTHCLTHTHTHTHAHTIKWQPYWHWRQWARRLISIEFHPQVTVDY